jgi:sarcosine oxidase subunit alpha
LSAAYRFGLSGLRVLLLDQDVALGGGSMLDDRWMAWREKIVGALAQMSNVRCLTHTTVLGAYGHGVYGALETLSAEESLQFAGLRERFRTIRAKRVVIATGASERLIAFPGNDLPGVMLAGAAHSYLKRYGVAVARKPVFFVNSDDAYESLFALLSAGIECEHVVDVRASSYATDRARKLGVQVHSDAVVQRVSGWNSVRSVRIARKDGRFLRVLDADALLISGGFSPATSLASQLGATLSWSEAIAAFVPNLALILGRVIGAAAGVSGLAAAQTDAELAAREVITDLGRTANDDELDVAVPKDPQRAPLEPIWEVRARGKSFVDLQNDVTAEDVRLAHREGYEHVEHMKRFTTHGMATDQGRIGGLLGSAVLAQARGEPVSQVGQANPRPFAQPTPFAALAGGEVREHFKPKRRLPLHDWHEAAGATFVNAGLWLRPLVYSKQAGWEPVLREARARRTSVGSTDV